MQNRHTKKKAGKASVGSAFTLSHKMAAAFTMGAMFGFHEPAHAFNLVQTVNNIITAADRLGFLLSLASYLGGATLAVTGLFKLRDHTDDPKKTTLREGVVRLGCGGALLSLPFMLRASQGAVSNGDATALAVQKGGTFAAAVTLNCSPGYGCWTTPNG